MELLSKLIFVKPENIKSTICTRMVDKKTKLNDIEIFPLKSVLSMAIFSLCFFEISAYDSPVGGEKPGYVFV